jgi:dihydrofolate synthase/folylpolyglutamate synthase
LQAALLLGCEMSDAQVLAAVARARPRGRCERLSICGRDYVLDVAHNPAATYNLVEFLNVTPCNGKTLALFSVMGDKDVRGMLTAAAGCFDAWFVADQPANPRAARGEDIAAQLRGEGAAAVSVSKNLRQALRQAKGVMAAGDRLVVFGSFHTVAEILPLLAREPSKTGRGPRT